MKKRSYKIGRDISRLLGLIELLGFVSVGRFLLSAYLGRSKSKDIRVSVPGLSHLVHLRRGSTDFNVFMQVFAMAEYDLKMFEQSRQVIERYRRLVAEGVRPLIVDCGANSGMATLWMKREFPDADIVAIEPSAENFAALTRNALPYPSIKCLQAAVWHQKTNLRLVNPADSAWAYRFGEDLQDARPAIDNVTATVTMDQLLDDERAHDRLLIIKIDIEGGEKQMFSGNTDWIAKASLIAIETHDEIQPSEMTSIPFFRAISPYEFEICFFGENAFVFLGKKSEKQESGTRETRPAENTIARRPEEFVPLGGI